MPIPRSRTSSTDALVGIWTILLASFVIGAVYFGRDILIPLALASLLTFLLAPLVTRLQRWLGRVGAVLAVVALLLAVTIGGGWVLTRQVFDLAGELPKYKENIRTKLRAFRMPEDDAISQLSDTIDDLKQELPGAETDMPEGEEETGAAAPPRRKRDNGAVRVQVVESPDSTPVAKIKRYLSPVVGPLGTAALVLLLLIFMLLKREDLRARVIRLIGQGRISATTRAMDDAAARVSRYLLMLLVVNVTYGIPVAVGLYFIGVPNAILWGAFAIILRFIPYVGPWIAASFPILLSITVSPDWVMPMMTIALFVVLEILSNNVMEPWLYGSSTGVTPVALIVAAVFWTWMWGPIGLVLATPFTVCMVVMGRHIPRMAFLSVMLSDEDALTPAEDLYHRLLRVAEHDEMELVDQYLRNHTLTELYDLVLVPVILAAEADHRLGLLDADQRSFVAQGLRDIVEDLATRPEGTEEAEGEEPRPSCPVYFLPARAERDEVAAMMLGQMLGKRRFEPVIGSGKPAIGEKIGAAEEEGPEVICISAVAPTSVTQVRFLCQRLRERLPAVKIVVGFWGAPERLNDAADSVKGVGADDVVATFADAEEVLVKLCAPLAMQMEEAPVPELEEERLEAMASLDLEEQRLHAVLDPLVLKISKIFEVEIAMVTRIGREHQFFLAQNGLPKDLAEAGQTARSVSICGHVVAANEIMVVEDLARDRRFANNPFVKDHGLRFYAGAPLRTGNGQAIGSLCLIGFSPRHFTPREIRLLDSYATEISEELTGAQFGETPLDDGDPPPSPAKVDRQ